MDAPDSSPWPEWIRYTLSALAGAFVAVIAVVKAWSKVKSDAEDAKAATIEHGPRIGALETYRARAEAEFSASIARIDEMRDDLKEVLRRLAK